MNAAVFQWPPWKLLGGSTHTHTWKRNAGTVVVWWASTGLIMMKSKVHAGPIQQLQFDATKVRRPDKKKHGGLLPCNPVSVGIRSWLSVFPDKLQRRR